MDVGWSDLSLWRAQPDGAAPLFRQIYAQVRASVLDRRLAPGARLPSSRALARQLQVSRTTVVAAYDQLQAEGWLTGRQGSGVYVADDLPEPFERARGAAPEDQAAVYFTADPDRAFGPFVRSSQSIEHEPFALGLSLMDARAKDAWRRAMARTAREFDARHLGYSDPRGLIELRSALCDYLRSARGLVCTPEQVVITAGSQHALDIASRALLQPGDEVWVEDPSYPMTWRGLRSADLKPRPIPVDDHGLIVVEGAARAAGARAAVVTPSHQYPTGVVLSMARRLELLAWAREAGAWIIEDDYDSELRHRGRPLASLQGLDEAGRVIYVGTLNKALFPGLRVGYAVAPYGILDAFVEARRLTDRQPPTLIQETLYHFMREGHLAAHFRRMRQFYRRVQDVLIGELIARVGSERIRVSPPDQGNHLVLWFQPGVDDVAIETAARDAGVVCRALSRLYLEAAPRPGLMLGFTGFTHGQIAPAARRLGDILRRLL